MKNLIQEACQGPLRDACKAHGADVSGLTAEALRPVVLRDFQVWGHLLAGWWVGRRSSDVCAGCCCNASASQRSLHGLCRVPSPPAGGGAGAEGFGGARRD